MTTAAERLSFISGLDSVSAAQHMKAAGHGSGLSAGALLVAWSTLGSNTAAVHLMYDPVVVAGLREVIRLRSFLASSLSLLSPIQ